MLKAKVLGVAVTLAVAQWAYAEVAVPGEEYLGDPESDASERQRATPRDDARARGIITTTPPRKFRLPPPTADERDDDEEPPTDGQPTPNVYRVGFGRSFEDHRVAVPDQAALRWRSTAGGGQVATFELLSPGAAALRAQLVFEAAPAGTEVRVHDPDAPATTTEVVPLTAEWREELAAGGSAPVWTPTVVGDSLAVEFYLPRGAKQRDLRFSVPRVSHLDVHPMRSDGIGAVRCGNHVDAACRTDMVSSVARRAVAKYLFTYRDGDSKRCTGTLLNDLDAERQTPLSHVNLRAVQDGVPNAYIGTALDDPAIAGLVGKYVRFEVTANPGATYSIAETTAEQVASHHEGRRPSAPQTPARDLSVTDYRDLDDIGFGDADAFGVKATNLAVLRTLGLADVEVPDGYALPLHFYDEFMQHNGFHDDVDAMLADADFRAGIATRDAELKKLRRRIENGAVPAWMGTSLAALHGLFRTGTAVRCRSSSNNEDLPGFSGAGLYDSYTHHPTEGDLSKSVKQVFASLWNLRAFEEREFHRVDHQAAAMGVLLHPNFSDEQANGVAVSDDPIYGAADAYYVNAQAGEELVTNPSAFAVPEELLLGDGEDFAVNVVRRSNLVADDARVLSAAHIATLHGALGSIHTRFETLHDIAEDAEFSMEIEFKVTAANKLAIKQARPWIY